MAATGREFRGLVREVVGKDSWYHSRSLLGLFPQTVLVFDKPGPLLELGWFLGTSKTLCFMGKNHGFPGHFHLNHIDILELEGKINFGSSKGILEQMERDIV